jgi:hypothetical protein
MKTSEGDTAHFVQNLKYYTFFQLAFVIFSILLSSIGAFFHFLLEHEISIVEAWLHNNQWEILIISKLTSLFLLNRWFKIQLYQLKSFRQLVRELIKWPEFKVLVISLFMSLAFLILGQVDYAAQNFGYWYFQLASFLSIVIFFGVELIAIAYIEDVLNDKFRPSTGLLIFFYTIIFTLAFRISVPDYYGLTPYIILCYASLIFVSGKSFKSWSNVLCFLLIFVAPMGAIFGLDPVWGDDFSPFRIGRKLDLAFLVVIWMISFSYYSFRDQFISSTRKLLR